MSPAALARMKGMQDMPSCPWCQTEETPTLLHVAWDCSGLKKERDDFFGVSDLSRLTDFQKRLGWPGANIDIADPIHQLTLDWLVDIRRQILSDRYPD